MTQLGIGVMLRGGSPNPSEKYIGRTIIGVEFTEEFLKLNFSDGTKIKILDSGQSCCESRYMTTDDDLYSLIGSQIHHIEAKSGPDRPDSDYHETCFVEVATNQGFITLVNHNVHNGYYGGFALSIEEE